MACSAPAQVSEIQAQGGESFGPGQHFERQLDQHAQTAQAADHQLGQVETGGIFNHLAAAAHQMAIAIDIAHADEKIAQAADSGSAPARWRWRRPCRPRVAPRSSQQRIKG